MKNFDMNARHIIEALRSGVPSRAVGRYFSEARPQLLREVADSLQVVSEEKHPRGMIITGKYGEGKTHLLNTVIGMAHASNMVVSYVSLGKETPLDKLPVIYQKIIGNTYLPGHEQPGFASLLDQMTPGSSLAGEMLLYATRDLASDKLYYLLQSYMHTEDPEERFRLLCDLEGDFMANPLLKSIYKRIFSQTARFSVNFSKTKHTMDYFAFMSHMFSMLGYSGWVILFDEAELCGRLGAKTRLNVYRNMAKFLLPETYCERDLGSLFTMFAFSASYIEDVISGKHEYENLEKYSPEEPEPVRTILRMIETAPQLVPLTNDEIREILGRITEFHQAAYRWESGVTPDLLMQETKGAHLLRTRIRAAIEYLDQMYQYGRADAAEITDLSTEDLTEEVPDLSEEEQS